MLTNHNTPVQFDIRTFVEFDAQNRAICPSCLSEKGSGYNKRNLSVGENGAYKCHRGCTPQDIRSALGAERPRQVPTAIAKTAPNVTISPQKVREACDRLLASNGPAKKWLNDRGITDGLIQRHQLGIGRAKVNTSKWLYTITIPISANSDGTQLYQKKRIAPWLSESEQPDGYKPWSQYGIPNSVYFTWLPANATQTYLCEGEWDAILLGALLRDANSEIACASFTSGAGNVPNREQLDLLPGQVIVFYDLDDPGKNGAAKVAAAIGSRAKVATVPHPDNPKKGWDISDALNNGFTLADIYKAASNATAPKKDNPLKQRLVTHDELMARAADYTDWLVPDLLTANELFLLAASPRAGKSLMAMTLAHSVASGGKFLGRPCTKGAVIYVRCEDSETKTKERAIAQGWSEGLPIYWIDRFKLSELPQLIEIVEEIQPRLIIWDTLSRIRSSQNSESSAEMSMELEPLANLCNDFACTGLLVHHTGKVNLENANNPENVYDTIRGSSAIRATCRGVLVLAASDRKYRLCVENGWGKHDLDVLLDANTLQWKLLGNWHGATVDLDQKERVLNYLSQVGAATIEQIAEATNLPKRSLYVVLTRLQTDEMIQKLGERRQAVYSRVAIQQIQQLNSLLNSSNEDTVNASGVIQQESKQATSPEKVIISDESDQADDHFSESKRGNNFVELGDKTPSKPDAVGDTAIQQEFNKNSTVELQPQKRIDTFLTFQVGDYVRYVGSDSPTGVLCGEKKLEVLRLEDDMAIVKHHKWMVSQTIPVKDLRRV